MYTKITMWVKQKGFTIVELLIVIVVIAILAAISIVAYNGIQQRGRDAQRKSDIATISKALELYYIDNGAYPPSTCTLGAGCKINGGWNTTADTSWSNIESYLVPKYVSTLPKDPQASTSTPAGIFGGYNYDIVTNPGWCTTPAGRPSYLLTYRLESSAQDRSINGDCAAGPQPTNYSSSEYYLVK